MTALRRTSEMVAALIAVFMLAGSRLVSAATVTVPGDFPTIQAVVDSLDLVHPPTIDTVLVSEHEEPPIYIHHCDLTLIGVPGMYGARPALPALEILEGRFTFRNLHVRGPIRSYGDVEFYDCEIDSGLLTPVNESQYHRFIRCTLRGEPAIRAIWDVTIDSCEVFGGIGLDNQSDGSLRLRNSIVSGSGEHGVLARPTWLCDITNNVIRGFHHGIVVDVDDASAEIRGNVIENCIGIGIQALDASSGSVVIRENQVNECGVGIEVLYTSAQVLENRVIGSVTDGIRYRGYAGAVVGNVAGRSGGRGVLIAPTDGGGVIEVRNNTVFASEGTGIAIDYDLPHDILTRVERNISSGNSEHGLAATGDVILSLSCNDWFSNQAGSTSGTQPSPSDLFVDPGFCNVAGDDVHLSAGSPLLDVPGCGLIGALGQGCASPVAVGVELRRGFELTAIAPNPGRGSMRIGFMLAYQADVELEVFDVQGRAVASLVRGVLPAGEHQVQWTGGGVPAGLYLVRYRHPGGEHTRRLIRSR